MQKVVSSPSIFYIMNKKIDIINEKKYINVVRKILIFKYQLISIFISFSAEVDTKTKIRYIWNILVTNNIIFIDFWYDI